jgi:hypothetical protein
VPIQEHTTVSETAAFNLAVRHVAREAFAPTALERRVLDAVLSGNREAADPYVRLLANAVLDMPEAERGLRVLDVLIDVDPHGSRWLVLVDLQGDESKLIPVPYPSEADHVRTRMD